jgi:excisionase family DNA binding protein
MHSSAKPESTPPLDGDGRALRATSVEPLLSARQVTDILGVNLNYVYEQAVDGRLPSYKIGGNRRFRASEVEEWLRGCRQPDRGRRLDAAGREP